MAGTLFSLALSQQCDAQGRPLLDAPLYIYEANTSTPVDVYQDFGLSVLHPWPLRTDSAGRFPAFWVDDGNYRARLTDKAGSVVYFDIANMQAVGPSSGDESGGGGDGVDQNAIFQTGDPIWLPKIGTRTGWVRANGRTIGSASSGATERANADTQALYEYLWNNFSNDLCAVTGGRGGSAAADFAANKAIATYSMRGRGPVGLDDMGNSAAGVIEADTPTAISYGGAETQTLPRSALPNETVSVTGTTSSQSHHHKMFASAVSASLVTASEQASYRRNSNGNPDYDMGGTSTAATLGRTSAETVGPLTVAATGPLNGNVTQTPVNTMNPYMLGTFYIKL